MCSSVGHSIVLNDGIMSLSVWWSQNEPCKGYKYFGLNNDDTDSKNYLLYITEWESTGINISNSFYNFEEKENKNYQNLRTYINKIKILIYFYEISMIKIVTVILF